jgi:hypothetical protein
MSPTTGTLGTIVSWRVPSNVSFDLLQNSLLEAGFDQELAQELQPAHALSRALRDMRTGRVIRKLRRDDRKLLFQFTREYLDEKEIFYEREAEMSLDIDTGYIECAESTEIADHARKLMAEHSAKRMTSDLTRLLHRIYAAYKADLIPIRDQDGAYFVPEMHATLIEQSRKLLEMIGGKLRSFQVRLGSEDTSESVANSMSDYLRDLIEQFKEKCESMGSGERKTRKDVIENRVGEIGELRRKLELYRGLLEGYSEAITEQVQEAETVLMRKLAESSTDE